MPKIPLGELSEAQQLVADIFINEGKLRAYEELLAIFNLEFGDVGDTDPYYAYYVKYVIDKINSKYQPLADLVND